MLKKLGLPLLFFLLIGCASTRVPLPVGSIPTQLPVLPSDEQYGHKVFQALGDRYQLDRNDDRINRVRRIVDQLTKVKGNDQNLWHVYVFEDSNFKNAAATRGNFIFVWTGLIDTVENDGELATILAHEIGHVLAGHTDPDPAEEVNKMLAGVARSTTRQVMANAGSAAVSGLAQLGGIVAAELIKALIVNPDKQRLELEADALGMFIMAEAGFDPAEAVSFWSRVSNDPHFGGSTLEFLSTHPASENRLRELETILPEAQTRFRENQSQQQSPE